MLPYSILIWTARSNYLDCRHCILHQYQRAVAISCEYMSRFELLGPDASSVYGMSHLPTPWLGVKGAVDGSTRLADPSTIAFSEENLPRNYSFS